MAEVVVGMLKIGLAVGLLAAWGFVLIPPVIRLLGGINRPNDTIGTFRANMSVLGGNRSDSRNSLAPQASQSFSEMSARRQRAAAKKRRRDVLVGLLASAGVTMLLALFVGGMAWALFGVSVLLFGGYVALLWSVQQSHLERRSKVAYFPQAQNPSLQGPALRPVHTAHN